MKEIEYGQMACFYDAFYARKDYKKEVEFLKNFIPHGAAVLDVGCGTGSHTYILTENGYNVCGIDKSPDMIAEANKKLDGKFKVADLLNFSVQQNYDAAISMFAVFNHLKNYREFMLGLNNMAAACKEGGAIIIDLHNPQKNGTKTDVSSGIKRTMRWKINRIFSTETTFITYEIDGKTYKTKRKFKIFRLNKLKKMVGSMGFKKANFYENYNMNLQATKMSKNIQIVINL